MQKPTTRIAQIELASTRRLRKKLLTLVRAKILKVGSDLSTVANVLSEEEYTEICSAYDFLLADIEELLKEHADV